MNLNDKMFNSCLVVTRHELLPLQKQDVETLCERYDVVPEFPQNPAEVKILLEKYDVVIGVLPINLIQLVQQNGKRFLAFSMKSLGTFKTEEEVKAVASQYNGRVAVLPPSKPGELFRASLYEGIKLVRVRVEETPIISH